MDATETDGTGSMAEADVAAARAALGLQVPRVDLEDPVVAAALAAVVAAGWRPPVTVTGESAAGGGSAPTATTDRFLFPVAAP